MLNDKHILVGGEPNHVTYFFPHIYMAFFDAEKFKELINFIIVPFCYVQMHRPMYIL